LDTPSVSGQEADGAPHKIVQLRNIRQVLRYLQLAGQDSALGATSASGGKGGWTARLAGTSRSRVALHAKGAIVELRNSLVFGLATVILISAPSALAEEAAPIPNEAIEYSALPGAPPGVLSAVLSGDLSAPGLYVLRNKWPANSSIGPHDHGQARRVYTVLEGEAFWGFGEVVDETKLVRLGPGSVAVTGPGMPPHYFRAGSAGVVFNVVAEGPFVTNLVGR
jgi:hypothetical protein